MISESTAFIHIQRHMMLRLRKQRPMFSNLKKVELQHTEQSIATCARCSLLSVFLFVFFILLVVSERQNAPNNARIKKNVMMHTSAPSRSESIDTIPKMIYQSWITVDGRNQLSSALKSAMASWKTKNSDYEYMFFDTAAQREWMAEHCADAFEAYTSVDLLASKADLFRYCLLFEQGGIWADADMVALEPLSSWLSSDAELVVAHDGGMGEGFMANGFIAAVAHHPALERAKHIVIEHFRRNTVRSAVWITGPHVFWRALNDTVGALPRSTFVGVERGIQFVNFKPNYIWTADGAQVIQGKYEGYIKDAQQHGGQPHFGRNINWTHSFDFNHVKEAEMTDTAAKWWAEEQLNSTLR